MDWTENLILYYKTNQIGNCPNCKSKSIEISEHSYGERMSWTFTCKDCGKWAHFDGYVGENESCRNY